MFQAAMSTAIEPETAASETPSPEDPMQGGTAGILESTLLVIGERQLTNVQFDALLEVFFTCDFKAHLVYDRSELQDGVRAEITPAYTLLAISAMALR